MIYRDVEIEVTVITENGTKCCSISVRMPHPELNISAVNRGATEARLNAAMNQMHGYEISLSCSYR
jgi:hypothetical protein